jgi:eukaryotic-like serine/threonine-protein kinase
MPQALVLDRYRLLSPLGTGAFATVWLALDERLQRQVAVKAIPQTRVIRARLEREAWAAARLSHPGIVTLYEAAADRNAAYLVSELVPGSTLEQALAEGRLSDQAIVEIGISLCDALSYAHREGIIHRDIKPSNVLIPDDTHDAAPPAKLTDFGVAHAVGGDSLTATGDVVGTAAYMAPEQAAGREVRPTADLYSLAVVLYEGLTGTNPLAAGPNGQRTTRLGIYLPPLRRQRRDLPRELGLGIDLALRPRAAERGTIQELQVALQTSASMVSDKAGVVGEPWRPSRRRSRREDPTWFYSPDQSTGEAPSPAPKTTPRHRPAPSASPNPLSVPARAGGAAAGAALIGWLAAHALASAPLAPAATALAAAALMLALPRLGFLIAAIGVSILALIQGNAGDALLLTLGAAVAVAVAPRGRPPWSLSVGAPLLGVLGLAGAWPAVAARATTARHRAVLGFTGWIWLVFAGSLAGTALYVQLPPGGPPRSVWTGSLYEAINHVLGTMISSGALAPAPVWALGAAVLPLLVRRKSLALDAAAAVGWTLAVVLFTELAIAVVHFSSPTATLTTVVPGAVVACAVAFAPSALARWRTMRGGYTQARLP